MSKQTMGERIAELRAGKRLTMLQIAKKCDLSESVVWKVEKDWPVRWETVHLVLVVGLKTKAKGDDYAEIHALWLAGRKVIAESRPKGAGKPTLSKHGVEACRKFRILIHDMPPEQTARVLAAAARAAMKLS